MTRVAHLIDDAGLGGVMRVLQHHLPRLGNGYRHEVCRVATAWRRPNSIDADIVVVHFTLNWSKLPFLVELRARLPHAHLVLVEHSYTEAYERVCVRRWRRFRAMLRFGYGIFDRVVAVSHAQAAWLRDARLVPGARLIAIPQACDTAALTELPLIYRPGRPLRLGAYGRYVPQKGFDILIEAMRRMPSSQATLELAGLGPDLPDLQAAAKCLPNVTVGGPIDGPLHFLSRVDVVVIPSRWEAFGLVAAEARAAGRPIVAARTDGLVEQVDASWGRLFPSQDPIGLAMAIRSLAFCDLVAMGLAARSSVVGALDTTIAQWTVLLDELATATAEPRPTSAGLLTMAGA